MPLIIKTLNTVYISYFLLKFTILIIIFIINIYNFRYYYLLHGLLVIFNTSVICMKICRFIDRLVYHDFFQNFLHILHIFYILDN